MQRPRYLITSSDERTWKFDRPVIFLGEWCLLYERRHIWQEMDAIVAEPYGLGEKNKDIDHAYASELNEELLLTLANILNEYHSVKYSLRFWRILIGHWLRRYVDVILNRVRTLEQCLEKYNISGVTVYDTNKYDLFVQDSYSGSFAFNDENWNNILYARILKALPNVDFPIEIMGNNLSEMFLLIRPVPELKLKRKMMDFFSQQLALLMSCFVRSSDALIVNSYLPRVEEIKLNLALWQIPQYWISPKPQILAEGDRDLRASLSVKISNNTNNFLENLLFKLLFDLLPICYLEGFLELNFIVDRLPWPQKPKFIFTSSNFDADEVFKLWTALRVEKGIKYYVGQHGNMYGTHRHWHTQVEELTADKFLTWGWIDEHPQHTPSFIFKIANKKNALYNPKGGLLLIELFLPFRITTWDCTYEFKQYFYEQQDFINRLDILPKNALIVRLHPAYRYLKWFEYERWSDFNPAIKTDRGTVPIKSMIAESRLVVHSYDSTGILETLAQNIPTLAFWQNGFEHLRDNSKPHYQLLIDAEIIHLSPDSIARKVNEVWDDVDEWWNNPITQLARIKFCEQFARTSDSPISDLLNTIDYKK